MRLAALMLAILLVAACPPRRGRVVYVAQPYVVPIFPVVPIVPPPTAALKPSLPVAPPPKVIDPILDHYLTEWEQKIGDLKTIRVEVAVKRRDSVFKKDTNYTGVALCMKPNYATLRLDNVANKIDSEAYICNGKSVYLYSGALKTITEIPLPAKWPFQQLCAPGNPALALITGMKAKEMKERFQITVFKTDDYYIYLDIKPRWDADEREFKILRLALYGPGKVTEKFAYLPARLYVLKQNGDSENWTFRKPTIDLPDIDEKAFQFKPIKGWKVQKVPSFPQKLEQKLQSKP